MFETYLTLTGNLITNVIRRRLVDGTTVVNFRVASNERRFDREAGAWTDGDSLYVSVTCWRQLAENVHRTLNMGDPIIVRGRLFSRSYDNKEGQRQSVIELEGLAVGPDLTRAVATITRLRRDGTPLGSLPPESDEGPEPVEPATTTASAPVGGPEPDDPWQSAVDRARDGADDTGRTGTEAPAVEAAMSA